MKIIEQLFSYSGEEPAILTVGKFDGIHRGHRCLIERAAARARAMREEGIPDVKTLVLSFDMASPMIFSREERREQLRELGVDILIECRFGPEIASMEAEAFVREILFGRLHMRGAVVGEDFRFGHNRAGDGKLLAELGAERGVLAEILPEVMEGGAPVSSTRIREALDAGRIAEASLLLGFPYSIRGRVVHGQGLARTMEMRTINLEMSRERILPRFGVYASDTRICGKLVRGVTNVGIRPTVHGSSPVCETWLFDFDEDVYGAEAEVTLLAFLRDERLFPDVESLQKQIHEDAGRAREWKPA